MEIKQKSLMSITIPIFLELVLITIVGNIDTFMLKSYNETAVGAVGSITQILQFQNTALTFICLGTTILISQFIGAKNLNSIKEIIATSLILNFFVGIFLGILYVIFSKFIFKMINLPESNIPIVYTYFILVGGFCFLQSITLVCSSILKSYGNTLPMLFVNVGVNILNVIGNYIFLFGFLRSTIPGVTGVALSTIVSRVVGAIIAFIIVKSYCKLSLVDLKKFSFSRVKNILSIGIPTAGENLTWNFTQNVIMAMVNNMGNSFIIARTYLNIVATFVMSFSIALGHGTAVQVGQYIGDNKQDLAYEKGLKSLKLAFILSFIFSGIVVLFSKQITAIFTSTPDIVKICYQVFPFFIFIETGRTFNIVLINSLHASGDIKFPMLMACIVMLGVAIPFSWLLGVHMKLALIGIWIANGLDEWIRGFSMLWRWKSKKWYNKSFVK